jgi:hypothetical protein
LARLIALLHCVGACAITTGTLLAFSHPEVPAKLSHPAGAGLAFTERVIYQPGRNLSFPLSPSFWNDFVSR